MNQIPEQLARDRMDIALVQCGWVIQNKNQINLNVSVGIADKMEENINQSLQQTAVLRQSILKKAFEGKL